MTRNEAMAAEISRVKSVLQEEHRQKMGEVTAIKDKEISDLKQKFSQTHQQVRDLQKDRDLDTTLISKLTVERDKVKQTLESYIKSDTDYNSKIQEISKLQQEILTLKNKYNNNLNDLQKDRAVRDQEITSLKSQLENSEIKYQSLISQFNTAHQTAKSNLDQVITEHKKDREELMSVKGKLSMMGDYYTENEKLKTLLSELKESTKTELKKTEDSYTSEIERLTKKLNDSQVVILKHEQKIENLKLDFIKQMNEQRKLPPKDQEKLNQLEQENTELKILLNDATSKFQQLQLEFTTASATLKSKSELLAEREAEVKRTEEILKNTPAKLLDPTLKKGRDEALANVRQVKIDLAKVKDEAIQTAQKLQVAENTIKDLEKEKQIILKSQSELKETMVNNLNHLQSKHEQDMVQKETRIKELENILMEKINFKNREQM
jgi:hypothetical protein